MKRGHTIVGFGGGTAIDLSKFVANHFNVDCIAIPSMLSTQSFSSRFVHVNIQNEHKLEFGVLPWTVILDFDFLQRSQKENLYGISTILGSYIALKNWKCEHWENGIPIQSDIWFRACKLLKDTLSFPTTKVGGF